MRTRDGDDDAYLAVEPSGRGREDGAAKMSNACTYIRVRTAQRSLLS